MTLTREIPRHQPDGHAALWRDRHPRSRQMRAPCNHPDRFVPLAPLHRSPLPTLTLAVSSLSLPSIAAPSPQPFPTEFARCKGALFTWRCHGYASRNLLPASLLMVLPAARQGQGRGLLASPVGLPTPRVLTPAQLSGASLPFSGGCRRQETVASPPLPGSTACCLQTFRLPASLPMSTR